MRTRALIAVLALPLVFAALPLLSLLASDSPEGLDAGNLAFTTDRILGDSAVIVSNAPGADLPGAFDQSEAARFDSKVMAPDSGCSDNYSAQS